MIVKKMRKYVAGIKIIGLLAVTGLFAACGGGGGTSGGGVGSYTGVQTKAVVTQSNAASLSSSAYNNTSMAMTANIAAVQSAGSAPSSPVVAGIGATLKEGVAKALQAGNAANALPGVTASQTINGAYSGSASFSLNLNQSTGEFSGSMTFSNYCELAGTATVSGSVGISGVFNLNTGAFNSLTMTFNPLSATLSNATSSLYGSIGFSVQGNSETMTINCTVSSNGAVYWLRDWTFTLTSTSMTISGQYYDPQYGYVDITTPTPLTVSSLSGEPTAGAVLFTGANGSRARMTFNNSGYTVTVDANGTGNWVAVQ